jgi:two-component system nitrate/nitrite sensor histidine kinase NarX
VLLIEADGEHLFDETETQLVEVTAQLLSMIMGFQGREQEGRRVALLEERAAIARELHDSLAQSLSFMKIQISRLQSQSPGSMSFETMQNIVNELREGLDNAYRELRELLSTFRVHMDVRGLSFAIQAAIDEFTQRSNLNITLDNRLVNCRLTVNEEFHILHVIREALSNIVRHSGATTVNVALVFQPSGSMMVTIDDDGIGYSARPEEAGHYGQKIMKERAYSLGGEIAVLRRRKGGTRVRLVFTPKLPQ